MNPNNLNQVSTHQMIERSGLRLQLTRVQLASEVVHPYWKECQMSVVPQQIH